MSLSWNQIKSRAIQFPKDWENETAEHAEAKIFWDDFFNVFGIHRRQALQPVKAHQELDKAVDLSYRPQPFTSETKRIEFLFELYVKYTSVLFGEKKKGRGNNVKKRKN